VLVKAAEQLDADDLSVAMPQAPERTDANLEARDGLRGNRTAERELLAITPRVTLAHVLIPTLAGPAIFLVTWISLTLARARGDDAVRRRRGALRSAERRINNARRLPPTARFGEIEASLASYLADRLNEPPARFLGRGAVDFLEQRGVEPDIVSRWRELIERCERAAYAGDEDGDASLAGLAHRCAQEMERVRL